LDHQHFGLFCQGYFDRFTSQLSRRIPEAFFLAMRLTGSDNGKR
jgi:hypothetical protein